MRYQYPRVDMRALCGLFGKTQDASCEHQHRANAQALFNGPVLALVADIREDLPRLGTHKLHSLLLPRLALHAQFVG